MKGEAVGDPVKSKVVLQERANYEIVFENTGAAGHRKFLTEKLTEPLIAGCTPIYIGAADLPESFEAAVIRCGAEDVRKIVEQAL